MNTRPLRGRLIAAAGSWLVVVSALSAESPDPWSRAVPLPTACYSSQDQFASKNEVAIETVVAETVTREEANKKLDEKLGEQGNDPMQMASRMQQKMMEDPQNAMKYMELMGATRDPAAVQAEQMQSLARIQQLEAEEKELLRRYGLAQQAALAPARAKFAALRKRLGITEGWGVGESASASVYAEYDAIKRDADRGFEAMCAQWFGAAGSMQAYVKRYKDYLVQERIPAAEKTDTQKLTNYAMFDIPTQSFRSTAKHRAVEDYMKLAGRLFGARPEGPLCTATQCKDLAGI